MDRKFFEKYKFLNLDLSIFLLVHFLVWTMVPLLRQSLPMDSMEAIVWGRIGGWITNKHPPFSGILANFFHWLFLGKDIGIYILSQLCVVLGFIYIYRIARLFLKEEKSILSVMLLEGVVYYGLTSMEFNVNIVSLALWPMVVYYFYRSIEDNKLRDWIVLGIVIGLNILNKYTCIYLFFGMFLYLLIPKNGRRQFINKNLYICGLVAIICIAPHVYWMFKTDLRVLEYFESRAVFNGGLGIFAHIVYPIRFIAAQIFAALLPITIYLFIYLKSKKEKLQINDRFWFIVCLGLFPILFLASTALISGMKLKSMWGSPSLYMLGIMLFYIFPVELSEKTYEIVKKITYATMAAMVIIAVLSIVNTRSQRYYFPKYRFVQDMGVVWGGETSDSPIKYVAGNIWYASIMNLYHPERPGVILDIDKYYRVILNEDRLKNYGLMIFGESPDEVRRFQKHFGVEAPIEQYSFSIINHSGKSGEYILYYSIIFPAAVAHE